ncbi:glycosyltransferase family 4 protein [Pseudofulvibacter geojedonensis]|uniref:Glycosyltransferase family 4 protein n=1 Tax=Pseudofulvibacter geojedonensis TaxID=1123758 RepID=A0ABW3HZD0_9FLAO
MNILLFTSEYNHPKLKASGGAGTFFKILAKELVKKGHKVYVFGFGKEAISFSDEGVFVSFNKNIKSNLLLKIAKRTLPVAKYNYLKGDFDRFLWAKQLKRFIKGKKIDIIETWDYRANFLYLDKIELPVIIRCHGSANVLKKYFGISLFDDAILKLEQKAFKRFHNIIAVSQYSRKINNEVFNKNNIKVIYNGINTDFFCPNTQISKIEQSIFYFGTLADNKGLKELVFIFNELIKTTPKASLHLIGKGQKYFDNLKSLFSKEALLRTTYYGVVDRALLPEILNKAHVFVFPTKGENFPFSFLEAMAMQKPVIVSNIEVSKEIISNNENGYIASSKEDFVKLINIIFKNNTDQVALRARKTIVDKFSVSQMVDNTLNFYNKIIDEHK